MSRSYTLQELSQKLDATLIGNGMLQVTRVVHPADYSGPGDLVLAMDKDLMPLLQARHMVAALFAQDAEVEPGLTDACLLVRRPRLAMAVLTNLFAPPPDWPQAIHPSAVIDPTATLGAGVRVGPYCTIGAHAVLGDHCVLQSQVTVEARAKIGPNSVLRAGVRVGMDCVIGARALIHFNAAIGADGFSFVTPDIGSVESAKADGAVTATNQAGLVRIASLGNVVIGDDVEIGANSTIDRGTVAATRIGRGTKIDNQVQIGHNVQIGEDCLICGRAGVAGSVQIGHRVVLGGAVGIADHVTIGDDAVAMAMSGISGHVQPRQVVGGIPAVPRPKFMQQLMGINRLKFLGNQVSALDSRVKKLEQGDKTD